MEEEEVKTSAPSLVEQSVSRGVAVTPDIRPLIKLLLQLMMMMLLLMMMMMMMMAI